MDMNCKGCTEGGQGHTDKCKFYPKAKKDDPLGSAGLAGYTTVEGKALDEIAEWANKHGISFDATRTMEEECPTVFKLIKK